MRDPFGIFLLIVCTIFFYFEIAVDRNKNEIISLGAIPHLLVFVKSRNDRIAQQVGYFSSDYVMSSLGTKSIAKSGCRTC